MSRILLFCLISVCSTLAYAQAPYLVKDFGTGSTEAQSSNPEQFRATGDKVFFVATSEYAGQELWVSDANGTRMVRDIRSGPNSGRVRGITELTPGVVLFGASTNDSELDLWRSDGTEAGTTLVRKLNARSSSFFIFPTVWNGKLFLRVDDGVHGSEPWVTDGTEAGTELLIDAEPGSAPSSPVGFFPFNGAVTFVTGAGFWTTDGTPAGTSMAVPAASPSMVTPAGGTIFFTAFDPTYGFELWKTDGTIGGTSLVKDIRPGAGHALSAPNMAAAGSGVLFFAHDGTTRRLWKSDGTAAGTVPIPEATPLTAQEVPPPFFVNTPAGVFWHRSADAGLWFSDGTGANTRLVATLPNARSLISAFSKLYFLNRAEGELQYGIWTSDGTAAGTVKVSGANAEEDFTSTGGRIYFAGRDASGQEPWVMEDAAGASTHILANVAPEPARSSKPQNLRALGGLLYFHLAPPTELWRSDGTSGGTFEVTDLNSTAVTAPFAHPTLYQGNIYFLNAPGNGLTPQNVYRFSAPAGGAVVPQLFGSYSVNQLAADGSYLYMWSFDGRLMRSDGTTPGTIVLHDPAEPARPLENLQPTFDNGRVWVTDATGLFRTDGTIESTRRILRLPSHQRFYTWILPIGGSLFAGVFDNSIAKSRLWHSDGTAEGSSFVTGPTAYMEQLASSGNLIFFSIAGDNGRELWRSDGTAAGTFMVKDIAPGSASSTPLFHKVLNGTLYFNANDGVHGVELWKSDGTEAGTVLVEDIGPGSFSSTPTNFAVAGGKLWFTASDGLHGYELWSSDGTPEGTSLAAEIAPGSTSSMPEEPTPVGETLFFTATTVENGRELWAMPLTSSAFSVADTRVTEGNGGTRVARFTVTRSAPATAPASVSFETFDGTATAGSDYDAAIGSLSFGAGETAKTFDVVVHGDLTIEPGETFFVRLTSPVGGAIDRGIAAAAIENDDTSADLEIETIQHPYVGGNEAGRRFRVTNHGPSTATNVQVRFSESPFDFQVAGDNSGNVVCENANPARCTVATLAPGGTTTFFVMRHEVKGSVDPANPPGRTVTASISSESADPDLSNNTTASMQAGDASLLVPPYLTVGANTTANYMLSFPTQSPVDVTLTSTFGVTVTTATMRIESGQTTVKFPLTVQGGVSSVLLNATSTEGKTVSMVVPVVMPGSTPPLGVAIVAAHNSTYAYGATVPIVARVAARRHDGTLPTGTIWLLDSSDNPLQQATLGGDAAVTFTRQGLEPGTYSYRVRYDGNANFRPLTVSLAAITIQNVATTVNVLSPRVSCPENFNVPVTVTSQGSTLAPAGSVAIYRGNQMLHRVPLAPTGVAGEAGATGNITIPATNEATIRVEYEPTGNFAASTGTKLITTGCSSMTFTATATSPTTVSMSWSAVPGATIYMLQRITASSITYVGMVSSIFLTFERSEQPNGVYVYRVLPMTNNGTMILPSPSDTASTFTWTDDPLTAGTRMKAAHLLELRAAVAAFRVTADLAPMTFTGTIAPGQPASARHVTELREAIDLARSRVGLPPFAWQQTAPSTGSVITAGPIQELRDSME